MGCKWGEDGWDDEELHKPVTRTIGEQEFHSDIYRGVPAHFLHIEVDDVKDEAGDRIKNIFKFFQDVSPIVRTIDLLGFPEKEKQRKEEKERNEKGNGETGIAKKAPTEAEQAEAIAEAEVDADEGSVRFQWDGTLRMVFNIPDNDLLECDSYEGYPYPAGKSFHVMEYMQVFEISVKLYYDLSPGIICDIVDEDEIKVWLCSR